MRQVEATPLDPDHDIDLKTGVFERTTLGQLEAAFRKAIAAGTQHVCVFFHGGLVSREKGLQTAHELLESYTRAGAYPFFFIWNSDLQTVLSEKLLRYQDDPAFVRAANRGVLLTAQKIAAIAEDKPLSRAAAGQARRVPLDLRSLAQFAAPYDRAWSRQRGAQLPVAQRELDDYADAFLLRKTGAQRRSRSTATNIRGMKNPLARVVRRLNAGHGHGLYTTVIEELLIAAKVGDFGAKVWKRMKHDIDAAFANDDRAGGTAFLRCLDRAWQQVPGLEVTLIGHSAGAIYVQRFVEALDLLFQADPSRKVAVVTLAAAVSFERMHQGLATLEKRVSGLWAFGLSDKAESGYWEVPPVYNKSLLYIVSSLCENDADADKPLVGMQRYWSGSPPYDQPVIGDVVGYVRPERTVWAPSSKTAPPGYRSGAKRHGGVPTDASTKESVEVALRDGLN